MCQVFEKIFLKKFFGFGNLPRKIAMTELRPAPCSNASDFMRDSAAYGKPKIGGCNFADPALGQSYVEKFSSSFPARRRSSSLRSSSSWPVAAYPAPSLQLFPSWPVRIRRGPVRWQIEYKNRRHTLIYKATPM